MANGKRAPGQPGTAFKLGEVPALSTPSFGGMFSDIGRAVAGVLTGSREERERRQKAALEAALAQAELLRAQGPQLLRQQEIAALNQAAQAYVQKYPELGQLGSAEEIVNRGRVRDAEGLLLQRPGQPTLTPFEQEPGKPELGFAFPPARGPAGGITPLGVGAAAAAGAGTVPSVAGQPPPSSSPTGGVQPTGVGARISPSLGYLSTPRPAEQDAANWAPGVIQGFTVVRDIIRTNRRAAMEALPFLNGLQFATDVPGLGNAIGDAMRSAQALGLSRESQQFVQGFLRWRASRVFAAGGKQLTGNEIREATAQFVPSIKEDASVTQQRLAGMAQDALAVLYSTGRAWPRIRANLVAIGAPDLGDFDPLTQAFTSQLTFESLLGATTRETSPYGYDPNRRR